MSYRDSGIDLIVLKCSDCGKLYFPPRYWCNKCDSSQFLQTRLSGVGEVYSYTIIRVPFQEFLDEAPYVFAEVKLDEGLVVPGRFTDEGEKRVKIGSKVSFVNWSRGVNWFKLT